MYNSFVPFTETVFRENILRAGVVPTARGGGADGVAEKVGSFALMTPDANALMKNTHNDGPNKHSMPLFLPSSWSKSGWATSPISI